MNKWRDQKTVIRLANEKKLFLFNRERKLFWLLVFSMLVLLVAGFLNGSYALGGWEVLLPVAMIANYLIYYFWSDSQVKRYETEHLALAYYVNDKKKIPLEQLNKYRKLKFEYLQNVLKNTVIITAFCGGLILAGQGLAKGTWLWPPLILLLPLGIAKIMRDQKHQINRFGKNGNKVMSR